METTSDCFSSITDNDFLVLKQFLENKNEVSLSNLSPEGWIALKAGVFSFNILDDLSNEVALQCNFAKEEYNKCQSQTSDPKTSDKTAAFLLECLSLNPELIKEVLKKIISDKTESTSISGKPSLSNIGVARMVYRLGTMKKLPDTNILNNYVRNAYSPINRLLRQGKISEYSTFPFSSVDKVKEAITLLDENLTEAISLEPVTIYRGGKLPPNIKKGDIISDPAFLSTTVNPEVAAGFAENDVLEIIEVPKGFHALYLPPYVVKARASEQEVLLPRDTKMRVLEITKGSSESPAIIHLQIQE